MQEIAYVYDDVGNVTQITDISDHNGSKTGAYVYDDLYRLTSATITNTGNSQNYTRTYTYSVTGNINSKSDLGSYTYNNIHPHAVTSANSITYTYDDNGSLTGDGTWTHTYDTRNRLTQSTDSTNTITYVYDEGTNRIKKTEADSTVTIYPNRYYEKEGTDVKLFVYAGGLKVATKEGSTVTHHHADHLTGAHVETDSSGTTVQLNDYYPYGTVRLEEQGTGHNNDHLYTGKELDDSTGLYYYGARYYDSGLGRFVSVDPLVLDTARSSQRVLKDILSNPQSLNGYSYVLNNPLKYTDPNGEHEIHFSFTTNVGAGVSTGTTWSIGFAFDGSYGVTVSSSAGGLAGADASIGLRAGYSSSESWIDTGGTSTYSEVSAKLPVIGGVEASANISKEGAGGFDLGYSNGFSTPISIGAGLEEGTVVIDRNIKDDFANLKQSVSDALDTAIDFVKSGTEKIVNTFSDNNEENEK